MDNVKKHLIIELNSSKINVLNPQLYNKLFNLINNVKSINIKLPDNIEEYYKLKTAADLIEKIINLFPAREITTTTFLEDHLILVKKELSKIKKYLHEYTYNKKHDVAELIKFHKNNPINELLHVVVNKDDLFDKLARESIGDLPNFIKQPNIPQTIITRNKIIPVSDYMLISKIKKPNIILDMRTKNPVFYNPYLIHSKEYLKKHKLFIEGNNGVSSHVITATKTIYKLPVNNKPEFKFKIPNKKVYIAETFDGNTARYLGYNEIEKHNPNILKPDPLIAKYSAISNNDFEKYIGESIKADIKTINTADIRRHIYNKIDNENIKNFRFVLIRELTNFISTVNYSIYEQIIKESTLTAAHAFREIIDKVNLSDVKPKTPQLMELLEELINDKSNLFTIIGNKIEFFKKSF